MGYFGCLIPWRPSAFSQRVKCQMWFTWLGCLAHFFCLSTGRFARGATWGRASVGTVEALAVVLLWGRMGRGGTGTFCMERECPGGVCVWIWCCRRAEEEEGRRLLPWEGGKRGGRAGATSFRVREGGRTPHRLRGLCSCQGFDRLGLSARWERKGTTLLW